MSGQRPRGRWREDGGTVTAFVVVFVFALVLLAGLVLDGGLTLAARVQAVDEAQAAARAGAQAIDLPLFRATGQVRLDPTRARQQALAYLAATGHPGTVRVVGERVDVVVSITQPMQILDLAGITRLTVHGAGAASPVVGVQGPGT